MKEQHGCLVCGEELEYTEKISEMVCAICGAREMSRACCKKGHYVCNECHTDGIDQVIELCMNEKSKDAIVIVEKLMSEPFCCMHGPEHHTIVASALLTAYANSGGKIDLRSALVEAASRGRDVPGGACGDWGACGATISTGIFVSIATGATPLTVESWGLANEMTARSLADLAKIGGPRCCKRSSYVSILAAVKFSNEKLRVSMEAAMPICSRASMNEQCIGARCPFSIANARRSS